MASKVNKPQKTETAGQKAKPQTSKSTTKATAKAPAKAKVVSAKEAKSSAKPTKASKPVTKPAIKPVVKPAAKAAPKTKAATKPATKATAKAKPAAKPTSKPAAKAAPKAKAKPAAKLDTMKVTAKAAEKTQDKIAAFKAAVAKSAAKSAKAAAAKTPPKAAAKPEAKPQPTVTSKVSSPPMKKTEAIKSPKAETPAVKVEAKAEAKPDVRKEEKRPNPRSIFKSKEYVVYPAHGVGQILDVEEQEVAGHRLELFVITFDKEKMTLRVPTHKWESVGMRKLSETVVVNNAIETLRGRARIKRTMWSRRAQEYEAKINSGDLISIAEVVRDLYRSERQPEQSYSERQLYEAALDRMAREVAVVESIGEDAAVLKVEAALQSGSGRSEKVATKEEPEAA